MAKKFNRENENENTDNGEENSFSVQIKDVRNKQIKIIYIIFIFSSTFSKNME